jgi:hypothetical protein
MQRSSTGVCAMDILLNQKSRQMDSRFDPHDASFCDRWRGAVSSRVSPVASRQGSRRNVDIKSLFEILAADPIRDIIAPMHIDHVESGTPVVTILRRRNRGGRVNG